MKATLPGYGRLHQVLRGLSLPWFRRQAGSQIVAPRGSPAGEALRLVALNTRVMLPPGAKRAVVVMSAYPRDGRSFVAANLSVAFAEDDPVLLVDGEQQPEKSILHAAMGARGDGDDGSLPASLQSSAISSSYPGVWLHPRPGPVQRHREGGLASLLEDASQAGFFTVVDSPPAATSSAAFLLARDAGHVIYVVRPQAQEMDVHRQIAAQLERLGVEIIGLVVNEV